VKIRDIIKRQQKSISFEFFAPENEGGKNRLFEAIRKLETLNPIFASVTCGAVGSSQENTRDLVTHIKGETPLTLMPHITCVNRNESELRDILKHYQSIGIENILALRGDPPRGTSEFIPTKGYFHHAQELVKLARSLGNFCIGVAVYPEGHTESPNIEADTFYTKQKIDAGADFAITQMFFDNRFFYNFLERMAKARVRIPISPGIMPITEIGRTKRLSQMCGATLPPTLVERMEEVSPEDAKKIGIEFTTRQCRDLLENDITHLHLFTLNESEVVMQIIGDLSLR
jgi:methylenetetrahydrofolate reductase (NADPH)